MSGKGRALSPRLQRLPGAGVGAHVLGVGADQAVVGVLLADVGGPAGHAGGGEQGGVEVGGEAEGGVDRGGVEVDVGVELLGLHDRLLDPHRGVEPAGLAEVAAEALGDVVEDGRPGVPGLVDAVAEAHHLLLAAQLLADPVGGPVGGADLVEHLPDLGDGPAVQRALEGGDGGGGRGVHVGQGGRGDPAGEGGGVQGVVGVQDQDDVEVAGDLGVGLLAGQGVEGVGRDAEVVAGLDRVRAGPQPLVGGDDLGGLGHQPVGLAQVGRWRLLVVGVEGGRGRHRRPQRRHGAGPLGQGADQLDQQGLEDALGPEGRDRLGQLGRGRQLQVVQEVDGLLEGGVLGQVGDVVAGVEELALPAVDVRDPGLGGDHALESLTRSFSHLGVPPVVSRDGISLNRRGRDTLSDTASKGASTMAHRVTFIPGDGVGPELSEATRRVLEATGVQFDWDVQEAGAEVIDRYGTPLPEQVLDSIRGNGVAIKGPLTTPIGTGFRSVNVALRKELDLYACLRPCKTYRGVRSRYEDIDLVVVRENHEDLYAGIEFEQGSDDVRQVIEFLNGIQAKTIRDDSGISIKPISITGTRRIAKFAFDYARAYGRKKVTAVTKANIMKHTDGLFYAVAREVAGQYDDIEYDEYLVDNMCMQLVQKPENFDVLLLPNLYGDILSDLGAGLVGGLGVAPGANLGDRVAVFEATHGSAPKYKGQNKVNPMAMMLSGMLMLRHLDEGVAADRLERALAAVIAEGESVTYDMKPSRDDPTAVGTSQVADAVIAKMEAGA